MKPTLNIGLRNYGLSLRDTNSVKFRKGLEIMKKTSVFS
jgi:hypothetical protein